MSDLVRHYTSHQVAKLLKVPTHTVRTLVDRGRIPSVVRMSRPEAGEFTAYKDVPQHMIHPDDIEHLLQDPEALKSAVDSCYIRYPKRKQTELSPAHEAEGLARRRVEDLMDERRLAQEIAEW